ncbi:hypothetical protein Q5P01_013879 [Channa striata]|uniref:Uncharacterized protein n=1 Tax=Channa striata TaxID=64152 RepID=A0AA88MPW5_CHASR|nr:hypothetical protein Q5P01_013879 [Channa striata]
MGPDKLVLAGNDRGVGGGGDECLDGTTHPPARQAEEETVEGVQSGAQASLLSSPGLCLCEPIRQSYPSSASQAGNISSEREQMWRLIYEEDDQPPNSVQQLGFRESGQNSNYISGSRALGCCCTLL